MSELLAIDPGSTQSAYVLINPVDCRPIHFGKIPNQDLLDMVAESNAQTCIEMIASYGMPVGAEVFDTCVWIGRLCQVHIDLTGRHPDLVFRSAMRWHHCRSRKAKDANVIRALVDRFAYGESNYGKGTKADPGFFYGFKADVWQAYALAVYAADQMMVRTLAVAL